MKASNSNNQDFKKLLINNSQKSPIDEKIYLLRKTLYPTCKKKKIFNSYKSNPTKSLYNNFTQTGYQKMLSFQNIENSKQQIYEKSQCMQINKDSSKRKIYFKPEVPYHCKQYHRKEQQENHHSQFHKTLLKKLKKLSRSSSQFSPMKISVWSKQQKDSAKRQTVSQNLLKTYNQKQNQSDKQMRKNTLYILSVIRKQKSSRKQRAETKIQSDLFMKTKSTNLSPVKSSQLKVGIINIVNKLNLKTSNNKFSLQEKFQKQNSNKLKKHEFNYFKEQTKPEIKKIIKKTIKSRQIMYQKNKNVKTPHFKVSYFNQNQINSERANFFDKKKIFSNRRLDKPQNIQNVFQNIDIGPW